MGSTPVDPFPTLSAAFVSADDAAVWAHLQIGKRRRIEYGGVILKQADRYFATTPIAEQEGEFDFATLLERDANGHFVAPAGYTGAGFYHSHPSALAVPKELEMSPEQVSISQSFFTENDQVFVLAHRGFSDVHYLSGHEGSLLKYVSTGSALEKKLREDLSGRVDQPLFAYFEEPIHRLAAAGELSVVVGNAAWGARGRVTQAPGPVPPEQPLFTRLYDDANTAVHRVWSRLAPAPGSPQWGMVLKHVSDEAYAASMPISAAKGMPTLESQFPLGADGRGQLPVNYRVEALYLLSSVPERAPANEAWLYRAFFFPAQIAQGIMQSRIETYLLDKARGLALYRVTSEGALLRYRCSGSERETSLMGRDNKGLIKRTGLQDELLAGRLTPRQFVAQVAAAGELVVETTGGVWDKAGVVDAQWQPYALRQPPLSPAFISADDAARYAHGKVAHRRQKAYAAVILQRPDQRFVVTEPWARESPRFALDAIYPLDPQGMPIVLAQGCRLYGLFCSRPLSPPLPGFNGVEAQISQQMFMDTDIYTLLSNHKVVARGYLSGSVESLIVYTCERLESYSERELLERVSPRHGHSAVARELELQSILPSAFVREQAYPERLRVLVASPLWGSVGTLPIDWQPAAPQAAARLPEPPMMGPVFPTAREAVQDAHARSEERYGRSPSLVGVVLKHRSLAQYVATYGVPMESLDPLLQICRFALQLQEAQFAVDSLYYSRVRMPTLPSTTHGWLARHFLSPIDLDTVLYDNAGGRRWPVEQRLILYIATLDGALLAYQPGNSDWRWGGTPLAGRDFVTKVAGDGPLKVLLASECWDVPGQVTASWLPFSRIARRRLSPAFSNADDAARYVARRLGERRDQVYGGLILRSSDGLFVATEPVVVHVECFDPQWIRLNELVDKGLFLGASTIVAFYHSQDAGEPTFALSDEQRAVYRNMFSTVFIADVLKDLGAASRTDYLLCNDGALLRYRVVGSRLRKGLLGNPERFEASIRSGVLTPEEWVNRLATAGELDVLDGSRLWGVARRIKAFVPYPQQQDPWLDGPVLADAALSPLFAQAQDAARFVHRWVTEREHLAFGLLLVSSGSPLALASMPSRVWRAESLALAHVFLDAQVPQGYAVSGLYLRAPVDSQALSTAWGASFFAPEDLAMGLSAASAWTVPLYLSCADGALLRIDVARPDQALASKAAAGTYARKLQSGLATLGDYLQKVALSGTLTLLQGSEFWLKNTAVIARWPWGRVSASWGAGNQPPAMGPLFLHPDDAARHTQRVVGPYKGEDYLGAILESLDVRAYVATQPLLDQGPDSDAEPRLFWTPGRASSSEREWPTPQYPQGYHVVMIHQLYKSDFVEHQDGAVAAMGRNFISWSYIYRYTRRLQGAFYIESYYLSTRDNALLKYTPDYRADSLESTFLSQVGRLGRYTAADLLKLMAPCKTLTVVRTGSFWRQPGPIVEASVVAMGASTPVLETPETDGLHRRRDEF